MIGSGENGSGRDAAERYADAIGDHNRFVLQELNDGIVYRPPSDDEIQDRLNQIFRASFPVSNGSPLAQFLVQATSLRVLKRQSSEDVVISTIEEMVLDPSLFYPPPNHAEKSRRTSNPLSGDHLDERIAEIWDVYVDIAKNGEDVRAVAETDEMPSFDWVRFKSGLKLGVEYQHLWRLIAIRDFDYLKNGRPKAGSYHRRYRSIAKAYVLDGQNTGSEEVNAICATTRASLKYSLDRTKPQPIEWLSASVRSSFSTIASIWEYRHQAVGQFAPSDFARYLGQPIIRAELEGQDWLLVQ